MIDVKKFEVARGKRTGMAIEASRLVLVYDFSQKAAAEQFNVTQQSVSVAIRDIKNRIARIDEGFHIMTRMILTDNVPDIDAFYAAVGAIDA